MGSRLGDADFNVSQLCGMLPATPRATPKSRTPADNQAVRNVFVIGPDKKVELILVHPMTNGRNFDWPTISATRSTSR
jgi:alkyl hydroperoxide reductase subunit AhpC